MDEPGNHSGGSVTGAINLRKDTLPPNFVIFDYWKDKMLFDEPVIGDWGEPQCWACKKPIETETVSTLRKHDFKSIWNGTAGDLQRCHIVPESLGGPPSPDNLFLMCPGCHEQAPNVDDRDAFLKWVYFKRQNCVYGWDLRELKSATEKLCEQSGIDFEAFCEYGAGINMYAVLKDRFKVSTHLSKLTPSTVLMTLLQTYQTQQEVAVSKEWADYGPLFSQIFE